MHRPRIFVLYPASGFLGPLAGRFPEADFTFYETVEAMFADASDCAAVLGPGYLVTRPVAERLFESPSLRWIQIGSAGTDQLDGVTPPSRVQMTRAGGVLDGFVAETALALLLALCRRIPDAVRDQGEERWGEARAGFESIEGSHATVVGFGAIGQAVAGRLLALGAAVTGVSRHPVPMPGVTVRPIEALSGILPRTRFLVLTLPGGTATAGMIGRAEIAALPPGAMLVNVGRGSSLNHAALDAALREGRLGGAGLDVTEPEPLPRGHPLWSCPNLLITPHVGGRDRLQPERLLRFFEENLRRFLAGEALLHRFG